MSVSLDTLSDQEFWNWMGEMICQCRASRISAAYVTCLNCHKCHAWELKKMVCVCREYSSHFLNQNTENLECSLCRGFKYNRADTAKLLRRINRYLSLSALEG